MRDALSPALRGALAALAVACLAWPPVGAREAGRAGEFVDCLFPDVVMRDGGVLTWNEVADVDVVVGDLRRVRTYGVGRSLSLTGASSYATTLDVPASGEGLWFLVKHTGVPQTCVSARGAARAVETGVFAPSWDSGGDRQRFDRDPQLPDGGCNRDTPEAWVLLEGSSTFEVIDSCTGTVIDQGDLDPDAGPPAGIAFSTLPGLAGAFAFVTQGSSIAVVDVTTRAVVGAVDLSDELGPVELRGVAAARVQDLDAGPNVDGAAFLYVAATVNGVPSFVVINQARLAPSVAPPVVIDAGPLGVAGAALDVTPIAAPSPEGFQRAWFTAATPPGVGAAALHAVLVGTAQNPSPDWSVVRSVSRSLPAGSPAPAALEIGAGRLGESALLPESTNGLLTDVEPPVTSYCSGGADSDQRSVSYRGPAAGGYRIFALDATTLGTGTVRVFDEPVLVSGNCTSTDVVTGAGPVALDTAGQDFLVRGFTADRDGDTVTVLVDSGVDVSAETISLGARAGACVDCPIDVEVQETDASACTIQNLVVGPAKTLSWEAVGCAPPDTTFTIYCRCTEANPADCHVCPPTPARCPGCREIGEVPLEPVGISDSTTFQDTVTGDESVDYVVAPNERQPLKVEFP